MFKFFRCFRKKKKPNNPKPARIITVNYAGITIKGNIMLFKLALAAIASIAIAPTAADGSIKPVENVTYASSDNSIVTVDENGKVTAVGVGHATITITADAQIGEGVVDISDTIDIEVTEALAVHLNPTIALV